MTFNPNGKSREVFNVAESGLPGAKLDCIVNCVGSVKGHVTDTINLFVTGDIRVSDNIRDNVWATSVERVRRRDHPVR